MIDEQANEGLGIIGVQPVAALDHVQVHRPVSPRLADSLAIRLGQDIRVAGSDETDLGAHRRVLDHIPQVGSEEVLEKLFQASKSSRHT